MCVCARVCDTERVCLPPHESSFLHKCGVECGFAGSAVRDNNTKNCVL